MEKERNIDRLAGWIIKLGAIAAVAWLCWYFRSVLVYIIIAFVVSLVGQPLMRLMRKVRIKGKSAPDGLLAILCILVILSFGALFVTQFIPIVTGIVRDVSTMNAHAIPYNSLLDQLNAWIVSVFPSLDPGFDIVTVLLSKIHELLNFSNVSSVLGSVASVAISIGVGLFSVVFISFFFIKDEHLFSRIICALVPDKIEGSVTSTISDITHLLSRYFIGLIVEVMGVILVDFLGLWLIARIGHGAGPERI